jgi:antitoxin (DNA-binding transcriptional repressor) of toxin-antitoxin stability system
MARNLRTVLDRIEFAGEEVVVVRNHHQIARIIPGAGYQTALEAMADLYRTLPESAAAGWRADRRAGRRSKSGTGTLRELRDPWAS